jgi:tRNA wybutosine-synthesizing protein 2
MKYREFLREKLGDAIPDNIPLPSGYHLVGHVVLLRLHDMLMPYAADVGKVTMQYDERICSVAVRTGPTSGYMRTPEYTIVAGTGDTVTTHVERGVRYRLDPLRVTFSGGNRSERIGMARRVRPGETVVDMFACVGQFSLPIAKVDGVHVIAIEVNPIAYEFLVENILLNGVQGIVQPVFGDCRTEHPVNAADRVVMGYLHNTIEYLPHALEALSDGGGHIHMHQAVPMMRAEEVKQEALDLCVQSGFSAVIGTRKVKTYSEGVSHLVFDIDLIPGVDDK